MLTDMMLQFSDAPRRGRQELQAVSRELACRAPVHPICSKGAKQTSSRRPPGAAKERGGEGFNIPHLRPDVRKVRG